MPQYISNYGAIKLSVCCWKKYMVELFLKNYSFKRMDSDGR